MARAISTLWLRDCERGSAAGARAAGAAPGERRASAARDRHRGTAWCTHLRELRTITSVTANETTSSSIAIADA